MHTTLTQDLTLNTFLVSIVVGFGLGLGFALVNGLLSLIGRGRKSIP